MPRALLSVYDKTNLVSFATNLVELGWDLVASGGTETTLRGVGLPVTPIEQVTGVPACLANDHRGFGHLLSTGFHGRAIPDP